MDGPALLRFLAPPALPSVTGVEMAGRCVPGSGDAGGDWYDVFTLPTGQVCAVIGDVTGNGPAVAAIMDRVRRALRACALVTADPAELLAQLNRMVLRFEPDVTATVLCAVFDHGLGRVRISSAGHPAPVLAFPGRPARPAGIAADLMLGVSESGGRRARAFAFPPGASLGLYTDGLVERRDHDIDEGIARLCAAIAGLTPEAACTSVMAAMADDAMPGDDITVLMLRRQAAASPARPGRDARLPAPGVLEPCHGSGCGRSRNRSAVPRWLSACPGLARRRALRPGDRRRTGAGGVTTCNPDRPVPVRGRRVRVVGDLFHGRVPAGAVYVGRAAPGLPASRFANPHSARVLGQAEAVRLYRDHLAAHPELVQEARRELAGLDLACWCPEPGAGEPDLCHAAEILAAIAGSAG